jgi:hypothetical protein
MPQHPGKGGKQKPPGKKPKKFDRMSAGEIYMFAEPSRKATYEAMFKK